MEVLRYCTSVYRLRLSKHRAELSMSVVSLVCHINTSSAISLFYSSP